MKCSKHESSAANVFWKVILSCANYLYLSWELELAYENFNSGFSSSGLLMHICLMLQEKAPTYLIPVCLTWLVIFLVYQYLLICVDYSWSLPTVSSGWKCKHKHSCRNGAATSCSWELALCFREWLAASMKI